MPGRIAFARGLSIGEDELGFSFVRASGPGGQNVNKVASAVQLRFDAAASPAVGPAMRARLRAIAGRRMAADGTILIVARRFRTQEANRRDAVARLVELLALAAVPPKTRRPTRPTAGSRERLRAAKRRRAGLKRLRGKVGDGEA